MSSGTYISNDSFKKQDQEQSYKESLLKCYNEDCDYKTKVKIKVGNNQRILLLVRHFNDEYYLILHQYKLIVAYPMIYKNIAPQKSIYNYKTFYEKGDDPYELQNKRGKDKCEKYDTSINERVAIPIFEGFNNKPFFICCSCTDMPNIYDSINNLYYGIPKNMKLNCPREDATSRKLYKERLVSIKKSIRHILPFYAMFHFKSEVKIFIIFNITIIKKKKKFIEYYKLYKDKADLETINYKYVLDELQLPKQIKLFDNKTLSINYSSFAFDNIKIPTLHNNVLLYPFYPEEMHNNKYDTLDYGCSYNKSDPFECIEDDEKRCVYTHSQCLKSSILIPKSHTSDNDDVCGLIGYNDESISKNENCIEIPKCIRNTIESYINKKQESTKEEEDMMIKLPIINGMYPHYILKKKNYDIETPDKRTVQFFADSNIDHYLAYEYYKEDRTEFTITIANSKSDEILSAESYENLEYKDGHIKKVNNLKHSFENSRKKSDLYTTLEEDVVGKEDNTEQVENPKKEKEEEKGIKEEGKRDEQQKQEGKKEEEKKENLYDGTVFYMETLNELRIINIIYSDVCDELNKSTCGVLVHLWNPSKNSIKSRLKLQCIINIEEKYIDEKNLIIGEKDYQILFFFKVPLEIFHSFRNCNVYTYGAFKLYDMQTYVHYKKGLFRNLIYNQSSHVSGIKQYSEGIQKFICCKDDVYTCKIKNIPRCNISDIFDFTKIFIAILIIFLIFFPLAFFISKKIKKNRDQVDADVSDKCSYNNNEER